MSNELRTSAPQDLKTFLNKHIKAIEEVSASTITPDKMVRLVCAAASRQPDLAKCTPLSILTAMMNAATFGLGVFDGSNEGYLVPFNRKQGNEWIKEAQFIPGYQGLVKKAIDSGKIRNIEARVVYEKDTFDYELGITPTIKHKPHIGADRGEIRAVYAVAFLPDGSNQFEVMAKDEIDAIKNRTKEKEHSPWKTDYAEMAKKTVVRRLYKYIPKSKDMAALLEIQAHTEMGDFTGIDAPSITMRPGDCNIPQEPLKVLNGDGDLVYHWSEEERQAAKDSFDDYLTGIEESKALELEAEFRALIGHPDVSPTSWHNRFFGRVKDAKP